MLINEIFSHLSTDNETNTIRIRLNPDSPIYAAHFPGNPITPGVCIIHIAFRLIQDYLHRELTLTEVENAKFLSTISPVADPEVDYRFTKTSSYEEGGCTYFKVRIEVSNGNTIFTKLSLLLRG